MTARVGFPVTVTYRLRATQYRWTRKVMTDGTSRITARAAPPGRSYMPVTCRYTWTERIGKPLPPRMSGFPKSAIDSMKRTRRALAIPGRQRGNVTRRKVFQRVAPRFVAASSSVPPRDSRIPRRVRYATGKKVKIWATSRPRNP